MKKLKNPSLSNKRKLEFSSISKKILQKSVNHLKESLVQ